jgi:hypothetical protein
VWGFLIFGCTDDALQGYQKFPKLSCMVQALVYDGEEIERNVGEVNMALGVDKDFV